MASTSTKSNKKKGGAKALHMSILGDGAQLCPKATKEKKGGQIVLKVGDGTHMHLEIIKQKEKKGEPKFPFC
jgi:hypothetical protein